MKMPKHNFFIAGTTTTVYQADLSEYRPDRVHVFLWKPESLSRALDFNCDWL